jgi:hypothetical protein
MRKLAILILLLAIADVAYARPDARTMTCEQVKALIRQSGSVVVTTGEHTYERFVSGKAHCETSTVLRRAWTTTNDARKCLVGFICEKRVRPVR